MKSILKASKSIVLLLVLFTVGISAISYQADAQVPQPCTPDCEWTPFGPPQITIIPLPGGCQLNVWWTSRLACNNWWDFQIVMIETIGSDCWRWLPLDKLFKTAYYNLIELNPMGFPPAYPVPDPPGVACNPQWRISQATCWTHYEIEVVGEYHSVAVPCEGTDCCLQEMRICRYSDPPPNGTIQIDPLGDPWSYDDCSEAILPPEAPPGSECELVCNWYLYAEDYIEPNDKDLDNRKQIKESNLTITDNILPVSLNSKNNGEYVIRISDVYGKTYKEFNGRFQEGKTNLQLDLNELPRGNYVYSIVLNGTQVLSNKIILIK